MTLTFKKVNVKVKSQNHQKNIKIMMKSFVISCILLLKFQIFAYILPLTLSCLENKFETLECGVDF